MAISEYANPVQNTLEGYIPLPLEQLFRAGQAVQQRGDAAQNQNDQVQTGLASMEALAPAHRDFVNKFVNDFKTQQGALLDKYQGNTSDPNFINASRRLNMQFAADPKLQVIKQANDLFKKKENIKDELMAKGVKFIDSNPSFTGVDAQGNLTSNIGNLKATNFDDQIDKSFRDKEGATEIIGNMVTNKRNLQQVKEHYLDALANNSDPAIRDGIEYYKQQDMSDLEAKHAMLGHIGAGMGYAKSSPNYQGMEYGLHEKEFEFNKYKFNKVEEDKLKIAAMKAAGKGPNGFGEITATSTPLVESNFGKDKSNLIDSILGNLNDSGKGIRKQDLVLDDTPENRKKYAGKFDTQTNSAYSQPLPFGLGSTDNPSNKVSKSLVIKGEKGYDPKESQIVDEARDILGSKAKNSKGDYLSDKTILTQYKQILDNSKSESLAYASPANDKYTKALTQLQFGNNGERLGHDFTILTKDGVIKSGTPEAEKIMSGIHHISANGINASPVGDYTTGSIRGTAMYQEKNSTGQVVKTSPVTIIKPMDEATQGQYRFANLGARAKETNLTNEQLRNSKEGAEFRIPAWNGGYLVPQKGITSGNRLGVQFIRVDEKGNKLPIIDKKTNQSLDSIPLDQIVNEAHSNYYSRLGQSIDNKPEKQSYSMDGDNSDE